MKPHLVLARDIRARERAAVVLIGRSHCATFEPTLVEAPLEAVKTVVQPCYFRNEPYWCIGKAVRGRWRDDDGECVRLSLYSGSCEWAEPIVSGLGGGAGGFTLFFDDMDCVEAFLALIPLDNYDV